MDQGPSPAKNSKSFLDQCGKEPMLDLSQHTISVNELHFLAKHLKNNPPYPKQIKLNHCVMPHHAFDIILDALSHNSSVRQVEYEEHELNQHSSLQLQSLLKRNKWLNKVEEKNPSTTLDLQNAKQLKSSQLRALALLIKKDRYQKIIVADKIDAETLKKWIHALRTSHVHSLVINCADVNKRLEHKARSLVYIERGIKKIFGKGDYRIGRNTLWYSLFGGNFVYSMAGAMFSPYALVWGGLGFLALGSLRIISNIYFHRKLENTKSKKFWHDSAHQEEYLAGRNASKSYLAWFNTKAWTTPGYLGYIHQQHNIPSVLPIPRETEQDLGSEGRPRSNGLDI